jgi:hypothetical protein
VETEPVVESELRVVHTQQPAPRIVRAAQELPLWHVRVTLAGGRVDGDLLRSALERMCSDGAFLGSARYADDRVELTYWDEAEDVDDAAALALRVWNDHRQAVGLPSWTVVGLEVLGRDVQRSRGRDVRTGSLAVGDVRPM